MAEKIRNTHSNGLGTLSIFEEHTDVIIKGFRDVQYGHKVNLSTEENGFITYFSIEEGNPGDKDLFLPVLAAHTQNHHQLPSSTVCDGGYAGTRQPVSDS